MLPMIDWLTIVIIIYWHEIKSAIPFTHQCIHEYDIPINPLSKQLWQIIYSCHCMFQYFNFSLAPFLFTTVLLFPFHCWFCLYLVAYMSVIAGCMSVATTASAITCTLYSFLPPIHCTLCSNVLLHPHLGHFYFLPFRCLIFRFHPHLSTL